MKKILVLGAGKSSVYLIDYLLDNSIPYNWEITVADANIDLTLANNRKHPNALFTHFDINSDVGLIQNFDVVVSLLPPNLHILVAKSCIKFCVNLFTASYINQQISELNVDATQKGILILMECGLDPGLDHLSSIKIIDSIYEKGGEVTSFKSYTGGLVAPQSDNNPWNYKISWNPKNVILAGMDGAQYLEGSKIHRIKYDQVFAHPVKVIVDNFGSFEAYPNRDSLTYQNQYNLKNCETIIRGTLRKIGFCKTWSILVDLGYTDDLSIVNKKSSHTYRQHFMSLLPFGRQINDIADDEDIIKLKFLGLLEDQIIPSNKLTSAQILQDLVENKLKLLPHEKDMIVMKHEIVYKIGAISYKTESSLVEIGANSIHTAMAKTVGIPLAIAVKLFLTNQINSRGVKIPIYKEFYNPILKELKSFGIVFNECTTIQTS